jgi:hypothetical protein
VDIGIREESNRPRFTTFEIGVPVGAENPVMSGDMYILVNEAAEPVPS